MCCAAILSLLRGSKIDPQGMQDKMAMAIDKRRQNVNTFFAAVNDCSAARDKKSLLQVVASHSHNSLLARYR